MLRKKLPFTNQKENWKHPNLIQCTNKPKAINVRESINIIFNIKKAKPIQLLDCSPQYNRKHQMQ